MYLDAKSSLTLYKVNLQFYFRVCDLMRENTLRWSEAGNQSLDTYAKGVEHAATRMLDASDWNTLGIVSSDLLWKAMQLQINAVQHLAETTLANQATLNSAVQEAVSTWQQKSSAALKETSGAMPISTTLQDYLQDYLHLLTPMEAGGRRKPSARKPH